MATGNLLEIQNLSVSFMDAQDSSKKSEVVRDVSLSLQEESFTSLVGESGSGKTVTSLALTRLIQPASISGKVLWGPDSQKKDLLALSEKELMFLRGKEISYVFQDPASSLNPVLRVGPQVAEGYRAHFSGDSVSAKVRVFELFQAVGLKDSERIYQSYPHELSGGMRQRALIAMALITQPSLLIADEPTTALDADLEIEVLNLLLAVKEKRKLTTLFITHDIGHATAYSDVIYVMRLGRIIERLEKREGVFLPKDEYTKKLFSLGAWDLPPKSLLEA